MKRHGEEGLTLIELMATIFIMGVISSIITVSVYVYIEDHRDKVYTMQAETLETALDMEYEEYGSYPVEGTYALDGTVVNLVKNQLEDEGVRYVEKAWEEMESNGLIREIDPDFLSENPYQRMDHENEQLKAFVVIDELDRGTYYHNELQGVVLDRKVVEMEEESVSGTLDVEEKTVKENISIEEIHMDKVVFDGMESGQTLELFKGDTLVQSSSIVVQEFLYAEETNVQTYTLVLKDGEGLEIDRRVFDGVPEVESLTVFPLGIEEGSVEGEYVVSWADTFCVGDARGCRYGDVLTVPVIDTYEVEGVEVGSVNEITIQESSVTDGFVDVRAKIEGRWTKSSQVEVR